MLRSAVTGTTTASRAKSLLLYVEQTRGRSAADALLDRVKLEREYLEDETRPLANERWRAALRAFAETYGEAELNSITGAVVHPENLGVWTRVLRSSHDPMSAYLKLDQYGGDQMATDSWHTVSCADGRWCGRVALAGDEHDELVALARTAELASVPLLFGYAPARVARRAPEPDGSGGLAQEFRAEWDTPGARHIPRLVGLATALGVLCALLLRVESGIGAAGAVGTGAVVGWLILAVAQTFLRRRARARAQGVRLLALERAAGLRELRDQSADGFREGSVIAGQYRLTQHLGAGASGAIWGAFRLSDGAEVAVKVLRAAMAHDVLAADRLRREAAALGLAWHPNVVEVIEDGSLADGTIYLVMERLRGESLAARLTRQGHISPDQLLSIALQVCDALGAVHAAGVIHRDLKPSNVFLHQIEPSGPVTAKVLDFGIARVEWAETRITNMGFPLGTPGYMSPEQRQGAEVDARSDLFAFGNLLYECLTGDPPSVSGAGDAPAGCGDPQSGVQRALQEIPEGWRAVIQRATAASPDDRYPDARSLRAALIEVASPGRESSLG